MLKTTRSIINISLPPEMVKRVDLASRREHRTRSGLVREALREYLKKTIPVDIATDEEIKAMKIARSEYARGEFVTLNQIFNELGNTSR
jgi:metal-responsive CopG/Arc/MetJ family transcriptional regulator